MQTMADQEKTVGSVAARKQVIGGGEAVRRRCRKAMGFPKRLRPRGGLFRSRFQRCCKALELAGLERGGKQGSCLIDLFFEDEPSRRGLERETLRKQRISPRVFPSQRAAPPAWQ